MSILNIGLWMAFGDNIYRMFKRKLFPRFRHCSGCKTRFVDF